MKDHDMLEKMHLLVIKIKNLIVYRSKSYDEMRPLIVIKNNVIAYEELGIEVVLVIEH